MKPAKPVVFVCLLAAAASVLAQGHNQASTSRPATMPASAPILPADKELMAALKCLEVKDLEQADQMLAPLEATRQAQPLYQLIRGCAYGMAGNYPDARRVLEGSAVTRGDLAETQLLLGVVNILSGRSADGVSAFLAGRRLAENDARFAYAMGVIQAGAGLNSVAGESLSAAQQLEGPFASAAETLKEAMASAARKHQAAIEPLREELRQSLTKVQTVNDDGRKAAEDRQRLAFEANRAEAYARNVHRLAVNDAQKQYEREVARLNPDSATYQSQKRAAERRRDDRIADVKKALDKAISDIGNKYRPKLNEIDRQIKDLQAQSADLTRKQQALVAKVAAAEAAAKPNPSKPTLPEGLDYEQQFVRLLHSSPQAIRELTRPKTSTAPASQPAE